MTDRKGSPLAVLLSAANVHDKKRALPLFDAIPLVHNGRRGRPRKRPKKAHGDKGYDFSDIRRGLRAHHITPRIARRGIVRVAGERDAPHEGCRGLRLGGGRHQQHEYPSRRNRLEQ